MASTSMVTSCKDYDDDISNVQQNVDTANELIKKLQDQATTLQTAVSTAQSTADAAKTAAAEAATAAKNAQTTGDEALAMAKTAEANAQAAKAAAAEAQKAAIEEATKQVNALKDQIQAALDNKVDVSTFDTKVASLEGTIAGISSDLNKLGNDVKQNQSDIKTAKEAIATLQAAQTDAQNQIAALEAYKKVLEEKTIPGLNDAIKANGVEIDGVKKSVEDLAKSASEAQEKLAGDIAKVASDLVVLQGTVDGINEAYKKADANLQSQIDELVKSIATKKDASVIDAKIADIEKLIGDNKTDLEKYTDDAVRQAKKDLQDQIDQLGKIKIDVDGTEVGLATWMAEINNKFDSYCTNDKLTEKLNQVKTNYESYTTNAIATASKTLTDAQKEITDNLGANINTLHILVAQRLSSIVYAPSTYVDGIEAIKFASLEYYDWGSDLERDAPKDEETKNYYIIKDAETIAKYLLNPSGVSLFPYTTLFRSGVSLEDIKDLTFVSSTASNITRAADDAPITVVDSNISNGYLNLNVKKTGNESFGTSNTNFKIVALKAQLADNVLTESEKKAGKPIYVYSDWTRLYETQTRPYIHNALAVDQEGRPSEAASKNPHFWNFSETYGAVGNKPASFQHDNATYGDKHIALEKVYTESVDLNQLVDVCDKNGTSYNPKAYGMTFEFHLMHYLLKNTGVDAEGNPVSATGYTDQYDFATLKDGILTSKARDGQTGNRDAVGRQPMIQVVLKEGSKVVDVRYFKIKWTDKTNVEEYGDILKGDSITKTYSCGGEEAGTVGEKHVNFIYAFKNMTRDEFHNSYELDTHVWKNIEDAKKTDAKKALSQAKFEDLADATGAGQTHNLKFSWNYGESFFKASQTEYNDKYYNRIVYGCYVSKTNSNDKIVFSLKIHTDVNQMGYASGIHYSMEQWTGAGKTSEGWNTQNKYRTINPTLYSDSKYGKSAGYSEAQLIGDLKVGYTKNGSVPASIAALVQNATNVHMVFDEKRVKTMLGSDWVVSSNGLTLNYKNKVAATITETGIVQLAEEGKKDAGKGNTPTAGALLLVGKNVPVKLCSEYCDLKQDIDRYEVSFMTPLTMEDIVLEGQLKDIVDGASSISVAGKVKVVEAFGEKRYVIGATTVADQIVAAKLKTWYRAENAVWNVAEAKTNLQKDGSIGSSCKVKLSDIKGTDGNKKYEVTYKSNAILFHNMSGNAISQAFKISVPVTVSTKWGNLTQNVVIEVVPNL